MSKRQARKARQTARRKKYGGKTFFGRMIKAGTGVVGGLLSGDVGGALTSLLTSQKVDANGNPTAAQLQENAQQVQAVTENAPVQQMKEQARQAATNTSAENVANDAAQGNNNNANGTPKKDDKNKTFKMIAIGVGVLLLLVIVAKVLTPKTATK